MNLNLRTWFFKSGTLSKASFFPERIVFRTSASELGSGGKIKKKKKKGSMVEVGLGVDSFKAVLLQAQV